VVPAYAGRDLFASGRLPRRSLGEAGKNPSSYSWWSPPKRPLTENHRSNPAILDSSTQSARPSSRVPNP
jgi:hypothetical protein